MLNVLVVEDDMYFRQELASQWSSCCLVQTAGSVSEAQSKLQQHSFDIVLLDLCLETPGDALDLLPISQSFVVVLSGHDTQHWVEQAFKHGCHEYFVKSTQQESYEKILERYHLWRGQQSSGFLAQSFWTQDPQLLSDLKGLELAAQTDLPILLLGPTGSGKTHLSRLIHQISPRQGLFVEINCAALPENLVESELFGHVKGSFTGATHDKLGLLAKANQGSLFLDEIGTLSLSVQAKLLKAIEEKKFYPVGSYRPISSDFRLLSATCDQLCPKHFRQDLYYRITGHELKIPSLQQRPHDVSFILEQLLKQSSRKLFIPQETREILNAYAWPGNVRELLKWFQNQLYGPSNIILPQQLDSKIYQMSQVSLPIEWKQLALKKGLKAGLQLIQSKIIQQVLEQNNGQVNKTLKQLKISTNTFYRALG